MCTGYSGRPLRRGCRSGGQESLHGIALRYCEVERAHQQDVTDEGSEDVGYEYGWKDAGGLCEGSEDSAATEVEEDSKEVFDLETYLTVYILNNLTRERYIWLSTVFFFVDSF